MSDSPTDPMIGRLIDGRYQVRSRIARGGMATVYLATDLRLERRVAIKIMHGHLADDNSFKARFVQEARSAARLAHPNVVNVYDQGQDADMAYLVMEYLPGITLRDLIKDYGRLTPEQTMDILTAVLGGLAAAHKAGIVHRDLKPENVLLADDGRIKIGDFGLARAANNNTATGQALLGTIAYLSPELVTRGIADARSDIYAIGIMTYEMLTGEQPYVGEAPMQIAYQHANDTVPMPSGKVPSIPRELDELVLWSTARDPEQRPRDARVMLDQLHDVEKLVRPTTDSGMAPTLMFPGGFGAAAANADTQILGALPLATAAAAPPSSSTLLATKADKRKRRGYWLLTLVVLLAAMAGGTGWYFGSGPGSEIPVPKLTSMTAAKAASALTDIGLTAKTGGEYNNEIAEGLVSSTKPDAGTRVPKGSIVMVILSKGRQPITLPALAGLSQDAATSAITDLGALVGSTDEIFHSKAAAGAVVSASRESDDGDVSKGGAYFQGLKVNLVVSLGGIPDVTGKSAADATAILKDKGLVAQSGEQRYSESIPEGAVIKATANKGGALRVGDVLVLTISRGPEPVEIPNVVGKPWNEGKKILTDLGFKLKYNPGADTPIVAPLLTIEATNPAAGQIVPRGATISLTPKF